LLAAHASCWLAAISASATMPLPCPSARSWPFGESASAVTSAHAVPRGRNRFIAPIAYALQASSPARETRARRNIPAPRLRRRALVAKRPRSRAECKGCEKLDRGARDLWQGGRMRLRTVGALGALLLASWGCGAPAPETCNNTACPGQSSKTYQVCTSTSTTVETVKYGSMSCTCDTSNLSGSDCVSCGAAVNSWCKM
jgi:hypothetical protein